MPMSDTVEMLQAILGAIDEGIHVVDANGMTIFYNHVIAKLDGLTPEEVLGKPLLHVFPSLDKDTSTLLQVIEKGHPIYNKRQTYKNLRGVRVETINTTLPVQVGEKLVGAIEIAKDIGKLRELSERLIELQAQIGKSKRVKQAPSDRLFFQFDDILTESASMHVLKTRAKRAARTSSPILIYGETGTGKELLVQSIHQASERSDRPFIAQNCAALPASLLESILFGTTKGSFTGADDRAGLFELANGGTLFLDEINSMPLDLQAKLLRVLEDGQIRRIGSSQSVQVDVRVIAATNEEPQKVVKAGNLRADLYYRINVVSFELPPLRERKEDITLLVSHFISKFNRKFSMQVNGAAPDVQRLFHVYEWPGNVRELEHVIEAAMNMVEGDTLQLEHLPAHMMSRVELAEVYTAAGITTADGWAAVEQRHTAASTLPLTIRPLREAIRETEEALINLALEQTNGNILQAAKLLVIPRQTLQYKLSQQERTEPN
ncbi:sigma-54 interaction domain-containing protein [Brevibacillus dissolubilis]|uniref:sigma-54 interaction domain-containing protein n=1 Tax=Brevibacillus dissolubilis TaxID=1844116 RepID=UPI0011176D4C|nr:sigma 54-interacting transcriptional regulator [Brevibacillus dissolubilis]